MDGGRLGICNGRLKTAGGREKAGQMLCAEAKQHQGHERPLQGAVFYARKLDGAVSHINAVVVFSGRIVPDPGPDGT